ncbi:MAG: hypothetical protein KBT21_11570 [Treponema sp.]|nr:hypothetical protein [Candidatus Treponema merdequi]
MIQNNKRDIKKKKVVYKTDSFVYFSFRIAIRMTFFLFLLFSSLMLFYFVGNYQEFLDSNQKLILNLIAITSIIEFVFSLSSFTLNIISYFIVKRRLRKVILYSLIYCFTTLLSVAGFLFSRAVLLVSNGL